MRLVSSKSDEEFRRKQARDNLDWPLRDLTANLMRIARGAGRPNLLSRQLDACLDALRTYLKEHGSLPPAHTIQDILDPDAAYRGHRPWIAEERGSEIESDHELALREIRRGALQSVASMLLGQQPQFSSGENAIHEGIRRWDEVRAKRRALYRKRNGKPKRKDKPEIIL
jgi:hypothetical protein